MAGSILSIGNKIELKALNWKNPDEEAPVYVSQLLDFTAQEENLIIAMPIFEGHLVPLQIGQRYEACFSANKGLYKADCVVHNRSKVNNIYMVEITLTTQLKKFQRREHFRLNCNMEIPYQVMTDMERNDFCSSHQLKEEYSSMVFTGIATDISGGGLRLLCRNTYARATYLVIQLKFVTAKGLVDMQLVGNVISSTRTDSMSDVYDVRVQFVFDGKEQQEKIIKYIFEEQRRRMNSDRKYFLEK